MSTDDKYTDYFYNGSLFNVIYKSRIFFDKGPTTIKNHISIKFVAVFKVDIIIDDKN